MLPFTVVGGFALDFLRKSGNHLDFFFKKKGGDNMELTTIKLVIGILVGICQLAYYGYKIVKFIIASTKK